MALPRLDGSARKKLIDRIIKRYSEWEAFYSCNREQFKINTEFTYGDQFTDAEHDFAIREKRPLQKFNQLLKYAYQTLGEFAQTTFSRKVFALDPNAASQEAINIREDVMAYLEFHSNFKQVQKVAFENALVGGYGAIALDIIKDPQNAYQQIPIYKQVHKPYLYGWDPDAREVSKQDGQYCTRLTLLKKDKIKKMYPKIDIEALDRAPVPLYNSEWTTEDGVWVLDYWEKAPITKEVIRLTDGTAIDITAKEGEMLNSADMRSIFQGNAQATPSFDRVTPTGRITRFRAEERKKVEDFEIHHIRMAGDQILERKIWPGKFLPNIFMPATSVWREGREYTLSFVEPLIPIQRAHNTIYNEILYRIKTSRKEPYKVTLAQIAGHEKVWENVTHARGYLPYNAVEFNGQILPPPIREPQTEIAQSLFVALQNIEGEFQQVSGRFNANLGQPGRAQSGIAIAREQMGGNLSITPFFDSAKEATQIAMKAMLDLAGNVIDNKRTLPVPTKNNEFRFVEVNMPVFGKEHADLSVGKFDLMLVAGANFEMQKQQALGLLNQLLSSYPAMLPYTLDLLVENLDVANAPQIVKRIRQNLVDPNIILSESKDQQELQIAQQKLQQQQQAQQMQQQMQQVPLALAKSRIQTEQQRTQNDALRAQNDRISSIGSTVSKLQDSQTKRMDVISKGAVESAKVEAEQARTRAELEEAALRVGKLELEQLGQIG